VWDSAVCSGGILQCVRVGLCSVFGWDSAVCSGGTLQCVRDSVWDSAVCSGGTLQCVREGLQLYNAGFVFLIC